MEFTLKTYLTPLCSSISHSRMLDQKISIYTILSIGILELTFKYKFANNVEIFTMLYKILDQTLNKLCNDYPDNANDFNYFKSIIEIILNNAQNIKQSFE